MRVLHVFKTYLPESFAGVERHIWEIAEGTADHGIESHVFSLGDRATPPSIPLGRHVAHKAPLHLYFASTAFSLGAFSRFAALAADADIINYHFPWPFMDVLHFTCRIGKPAVLTYHSDIVRQKTLYRLYKPLMHRFLRSVDHIVATSPNYAATSPVLQRFANKTSIIPIGLRTTAEKADARRVEQWRRRVGHGFMLFIGALRYYKGLTYLAEAAELSGLKVVVAGAGECEAELAKRNSPEILLTGQVSEDDKAALLELCTAFVFPSHLRSEAFGIALLEAARAERPLITCEIGTGTSYINVDCETGYVVPPTDARALAAAMRRLADDPATATRMGQAAKRRFEALFRRETMARDYADLYRKLNETYARP